jgi:copper transport protein
MRRLQPQRALAGVVVLVVALLTPATADAHALLTRSTPEDGASLTAAPRDVRLVFSEGVSARLSWATLLDTRGRPVAGVHLRPNGSAALRVVLPELTPGAYRLVWRTVAGDDLHATEGSLVFGVGAPASGAVAAPAVSTARAGALESALRTADLAALAAALGSVAILLICIPGATDAATTPSLRRASGLTRRFAAGAAAAALTTGIAVVVQSGRTVGASSAGELLDRVVLGTSFGQRYAARELFVAGLLAFVLLERPRRRRERLAVAGTLAAGISLAQASAGHATGLGSDVAVATASMALHVLSAALWSGGLATVVVLAATALRADRPARVALLRAFGRVALPATLVLLITGLYALGRMTPTTDALLRSAYGHVLLVKLAVVGAVALLGAMHALRLGTFRPVAAARPPRRTTLVAEAGLALAVLCAAAVLASSAPATAPPPSSGTDAGSVEVAGHADDLVTDVSIAPNRPGQNFVTVTVLNSLRPAPAPVASVRVRLTAPGGQTVTLPAQRTGPGMYQTAGDAIDRAGEWRVELLVSRSGLPEARFASPWNVAPTVLAPQTAVRVTQGPLRTLTGAGAVLLSVLLVLTVLGRLFGRIRRPAPEAA